MSSHQSPDELSIDEFLSWFSEESSEPSIIVPGYGRIPNDVLLCGEAPGAEEAEQSTPFVGKSGQEQAWYLSPYNLNPRDWYLTNLCKDYIPGNPDPTPSQISHWTPLLLSEVSRCKPTLIVAVGRYAIRWFLGNDADLDTVHGIPHRAGAFDSSLISRASCPILPVIHPAAGFYSNESRTLISWDYSQVAATMKQIRSNQPIQYREDEYLGKEVYLDVTGRQLSDLISESPGITEIALDTEGFLYAPWSIQVSWEPGKAYVLRYGHPDFDIGIKSLQRLADSGCLFILHCANTPAGGMYDIIMCRSMGLDLSRANIFDTMYALYLLRIEPKGLKPAAYRWCGMQLYPYMDLIEGIGKSKQIDYLTSVLSYEWPKPESRKIRENDGRVRNYTPNRVDITVSGILRDIWSGKVNKDGMLTDPAKRWEKIDPILQRQVQSKLGSFPYASLDDVSLADAVLYSARDADATLRLKRSLVPRLREMDLLRTMDEGMSVVTLLESMQSNGMTASRRKFIDLYSKLDSDVARIGSIISNRFWGGKPFNPGSPKQVGSLLRRRGLVSSKKTKTGQMSTGKKAIEHLRFQDEAIDLVFDWREVQHLRDSFCQVTLDIIPEDLDLYDVRCNFKIAHTETRRLATEDPNLLAIPSRTELGRMIRACYIAREGELFGAWDFSQIEARFLAHETEDPLLIKFFLEGRDVHSETAARLFFENMSSEKFISLYKSGDSKAKESRRTAKDINFGIIYGIQGPGLFDQFRMRGLTNWDVKSCSAVISDWYKIYRKVKQYQLNLASEVRRKGYVRDLSGMYRYLPNIWATRNRTFYNWKEKREAESLQAEAERHAVSHRIQGGAQTVYQRALAYLKPILWKMQDAEINVLPRLPIHDELVMTFDEDYKETIHAIVIDAFVNHCGIRLKVPIEADGHTGKTWADCK